MQLIKLSVFDGSEEIRTIQFKDGINIITNLGETGNQIGKSTSLRALAFCLGGKSEPLWKDPDNNKVNEKVKDYLTKGDVKFELTLRVASINHQITRVLSRKMDPYVRASKSLAPLMASSTRAMLASLANSLVYLDIHESSLASTQYEASSSERTEPQATTRLRTYTRTLATMITT